MIGGVSKRLLAALAVTVVLATGVFAWNLRDAARDPAVGDSGPNPALLSLTDDPVDRAVATTWVAPPVTRDPFTPPDGVTVEAAPEFGSSAVAADEPEDPQGSTTLPLLQPVRDDRPLDEVVDSRVPSTTVPPTVPPAPAAADDAGPVPDLAP